MAYIQSYKEAWLLPPRVEDLIPEDHICFLVESIVESMDFRPFDTKYLGAGHPAYHPSILLKLMIMGILDRVHSSRRLAKNARENVVYIYLAEKLTPDFRTISDFRKNNTLLVKEAFRHTVTIAKQVGMLDLSHFCTDGTKIKANASNRRVFNKKELAFLLKFVDEELTAWGKQDPDEDAIFDKLRGIDQLPLQSKKLIQKTVKNYIKKFQSEGNVFKGQITDKLNKVQKELEQNQLRQVSITDPESRFIKNGKGRIELSYNAQITVEKRGFILSTDVYQNACDSKHLQPQVRQTEENLGLIPEDVSWSFDSGYFESDNIKFLADEKIDAYVPKKTKKNSYPYNKTHFSYDTNKDEYICPETNRLVFVGKYFDKPRSKFIKRYDGQSCSNCKVRSECTRNKKGIRSIKEYPHEFERNAMKAKMKTAKAKKFSTLRSQTVEPVFGDIKENKGLRRFAPRGLNPVRTEFTMVCIASNLKKMWKYLVSGQQNAALKSQCFA